MSAGNKPNELYITRVYDAPVKLVWDAWTDPAQVAQWWGPRGFTITTHSKDLRPGGSWVYTMHGPDGVDYPNSTKYYEVQEHALLVYDHGASEDRPPLFRVTVKFKEVRGKTRMEMTMALATAEAAAETKKFIKKAGGDSTWDRLAEYLGQERDGVDRFVINRAFEAPIDTVFRMWTDPEHLAKWMPPTGSTMKFIRANISTGGETLFQMSNGAGMTMYGRAKYIEITPPSRLVYTQQFCDEKEQLARHPMAPTWPATMLTTVTFEAEDSNRTRVTVDWEVHGEATPVERDTFRQAKGGMTMGWTGSFDKLEDLLS
jgi:uncharacterized protein YndB with AHSA1/START domain